MFMLDKIVKQKKERPETPAELLGKLEIRDGIIITEDHFITMIEVLPINFRLKNQVEKDFITKTYEDLLKIVKIPFQIFTIAKRADSKSHLEFLDQQQKTETEENVITMIEEYKKFVADVSYRSAVRKRFIVVIPYIPPEKRTEGADFQFASSYLAEKRQAFVENIKKCGNDTIIPQKKDANRFTSEILYELLNVNSSEAQRMVTL